MSDAAFSAFAPDPAVRARLDRFVQLVLTRNAALNLTSARDAAAIEEHVLDALRLVPFVSGPLLDVGSGGGFPALPIAIAAGVKATLVESVAKRATFLREAAAALALDVEVVAVRAEDAGRDPRYREQFASATARAVGPLTTVLELTVPFLRVGGAALLQRGEVTEAERQALTDASLVLGAEVEREVRDEVSRERRIFIVRKVAPTGPRFPRRAGIPAKRPLCWTDAGRTTG